MAESPVLSASPDRARPRVPGALRTTAGIVALAIVYAALALLGLRWGIARGVASPVWPAGGVALAALVLSRGRYWPGIALGYLAAAALNHSPNPAWTLATIAAGNTGAAVAGAWVLRCCRVSPAFERFRDFVVFCAVALGVAVLAATVGSLAIGLSIHLPSERIGVMWMHWMLGDLTGVLVVGTLVLAWARGREPRRLRWWFELAACLIAAGLIGTFVFLREGERMYTFIAFCPLIWAALSLRLRGASAACALMAVLGVTGTSLGTGPFAMLTPHARYLDLQVFIAVTTVAALVLAVVADERRSQRALVLSEARLRLALEASDTGLWKVDLHSGAVNFSPECAAVTGLTAQDVERTRSGVVRLVHEDDQARVRAAFQQALASRSRFESEFRIVRPDRSEIWLQARGRALFDGDGRPTTMLGTITDVTARRRSERQLEEQARLLDLTRDAILVRDVDGRIRYWNDSSERLYGFTREQAIGRMAHELLQTEFPKPLREIAAELLREDRWEGELVHRRRDGEALIVLSRWVLTRDGTGRPQSVMQTQTDITERKRGELSSAFLVELDHRIAQAASADDVAETGLHLLGAHLGLLRCTLSDIDLEHARIRTLHEWTDGAPRVTGSFDAREFFTSELGIALASGEAVAIRDLRVDPLTAPFAANYLPYGTVALAAASYVIEGRLAGTLTVAAGEPRSWRVDEMLLLREVVARLWPAIERAKAIAALRESELRFRQLADTAPIMIWVAEADGRCSYVSKRWTEFTGRVYEAELDFGWRAVVHPEDLAGYAEGFERAATAQTAYSAEYRALRWDGAWRWLHATARPRFGAGSEFLGYIGAVMDVTERREAEEALREADRRKDEFLATLAHELRNPLSPIRTGLQVLDLTDDVETARRTRRMMDRQLGHMVRLIDDLLDVSRITSGKVVLQRERIPLQDAALAAVESARPQIEAARHRLTVDLPEAPLWIDADPTRIAQVMGNLLTNAAKYTPEGGDIALRVHECDGAACVTVTDTGLGIPPEALGDVFGMFAQVNRTLDRSQGGLGIGLALARRLVEMHGGSIVAESAGLGQGSAFTVRLPMALPPATVIGTPSRSGPDGVRHRVLVVDDNEDAATSLAMMLELEGHATRTAFDGAEGLRLAAEFRPDVAFLDIGMPGMNGYELARALRLQPGLESTLLVAVSGWGGANDKERSAEAGFDLHLTKPVSVEAIEDAVMHAVRTPAGPRPQRAVTKS
ncbi:PAS domain S-box protein [Lysobacter xanthus]